MLTPRPGDFFLAPIDGAVGQGIRFGQWLNGEGFIVYQHAGILLENGQTIEAMPGGAIIGDIDKWNPKWLRWSTKVLDLSDAEREAICTYGRACKDIPYSFLDYAALAAHRFHVPTPGLKNFIEDSHHMICSQLVDRVYELAGVHLFKDGRWPGYVTPASLDMLLDELDYYKQSQGI